MRAPRIHRGGLALAVLCAIAAAAPAWAAHAGQKGNGSGKGSGKTSDRSTDKAAATEAAGLPAAELDSLRQALIGADDEAATEAAAKLGAAGTPRAAEPLLEVLAEGGRAVRVQAVLDAFAKLGEAHALRADQAVIDALTLYAGHRSPDIRRRAVKALASVSDAHVTATLLERLGDAAPDVRAAAADALAARRETKAVPRLFALLSRGDAGVGAALASLATPDLVPRIAELAGTIDDEIVANTLGEYVKRSDVPEKLRIDVLRTIGRLSGAVATTALAEYLASVPAKEDRASKKEAQKLLDQRGGGAQ